MLGTQLAVDLAQRHDQPTVHIITLSNAVQSDPLWYQLYHEDSGICIADVLLPQTPEARGLKDTANALLHATDRASYFTHTTRFIFPWTPHQDALAQLQQTLRRIHTKDPAQFAYLTTDLDVLDQKPDKKNNSHKTKVARSRNKANGPSNPREKTHRPQSYPTDTASPSRDDNTTIYRQSKPQPTLSSKPSTNGESSRSINQMLSFQSDLVFLPCPRAASPVGASPDLQHLDQRRRRGEAYLPDQPPHPNDVQLSSDDE